MDMDTVVDRFAELIAEHVVTKMAGKEFAIGKTAAKTKPGKTEKPKADDGFDMGGEAADEPGDDAPTVETVIEALQKYAEENSRDDAKKILASFKVKSVHDLDEKDFPKILKKLS